MRANYTLGQGGRDGQFVGEGRETVHYCRVESIVLQQNVSGQYAEHVNANLVTRPKVARILIMQPAPGRALRSEYTVQLKGSL